MALLVTVAVVLLAASANGGMMMNMMGGQQQGGMMGQQHGGMMGQQQGGMMVPMGNSGCQQGQGGGCEVPMPSMDNMEEYLKQQMEAQQYETQQMAEKIKAQFESMVESVNMKKYRYVMSLVTEYVSFCECARSSDTIYRAIFLQSANALNMTDSIEVWDASRKPYEAKNEEEARGLIFGGLVQTMCESAGTFLAFADQVSQRIPAFQGKK